MLILDGLHLYELILLILGILLFILAAVLLVIQILRHRDARVLIPLFAIAVLMIGFPGIKSINFGDMKAELKSLSVRLEADPGDSLARQRAALIIARMEARPVSSDDTRRLIDHVRLILREEPPPPDSGTGTGPTPRHPFQPDIIEIEKLIGVVETQPGNKAARDRLQLLVHETGNRPELSAEERALVKRAADLLKPRQP
ncbi:MAG: hypothetical protein ABIK37_04300 [candidate division WOR-3 bacterium]